MNTEEILNKIQTICLTKGQDGLKELTLELDKVQMESFAVAVTDDIVIDKILAKAIETARQNIYKFHKSEHEKLLAFESDKVETSPEIICWKKFTPIQNVGIYIPSKLFSSVLMNVIPAQIAGCKNIVICTPPNPSKEILYTLNLLNIKKIYTIGGAQAIFAMAHGIGEIPKVSKIFGPGNEFVDGAKKMVSNHTAIDMPAGPSEVLVISDGVNPKSIATDILAQLEHGRESKAWLFYVGQDSTFVDSIGSEIKRMAKTSQRWNVLEYSIRNLVIKRVESINFAIEESNNIAPEHLILNVENAEKYLAQITDAGSVFIGRNTPESLGDYLSGTNHVLPTSGFARAFSGLCVLSFGKFTTFQKASKFGIENIGQYITTMAMAEGLEMHAESVVARQESKAERGCIGILNSGGYNINSIKFALERISNCEIIIVKSPQEFDSCEKIIIPGVGHASTAMNLLREQNLVDSIKNTTKPVLGICLGMQIMFNHSAEGNIDCLGIFQSDVIEFPHGIQSPQMGWNRLNGGKYDGEFVFFANGYYAPCGDYTESTVEHCGVTISAIVRNANFFGCQFHPEKSGKVGEQILKDFLNIL